MVVCFLPRGRGDWSYALDVLKRGVCLEGSCYRFLGHSDHQLREKTCLLIKRSDLAIYDILSRFVDFFQVRNPAKRADCINVLFTGFETTLDLPQREYFEIEDERKGRHNFTHGCGFMSQGFASEVQLSEQLFTPPSAAVVLYQGSCGVLVTRRDLKESKVEFRESMRKFTIADNELREKVTTFAVLDYSRPYTSGYLNIQSVMLLADRGVSHDYLKQLQEDYYLMLGNLCTNRSRAAYFLRTTGNSELFQMLQITGLKGINKELEKLRDTELENMKRCDEIEGGRNLPNPYHGMKTTLRVFVPKSRIVLGVCDPYGILNYGECYFKPTMSEEEEDEFEEVDQVVVIRHPSYYPGDALVIDVQRNAPEYEHLRDCIVFPVRGSCSHALECGGGNLDGDKFFVIWDRNLIPCYKAPPHDYGPSTLKYFGSSISETLDDSLSSLGNLMRAQARNLCRSVLGTNNSYERRVKIATMYELTEYFAEYSPDLYYRFDCVYMNYASMLGPSSKECRQLHEHYSQVVSGVTEKHEFFKILERYDDEFQVLRESSSEQSLPSQALQGILVGTGLAKPPFQRGDDVWEKMERRSKEFLEQSFYGSQ
ncbi:hypothetical protein QZH41_003410 [Actinostola sp. cb2023]|nr:hypothetical protein QZH41_003410 [Actinostola sp. cb2023]